MRTRDFLAVIFLGQAAENIQIYYGWDKGYDAGINILGYAILLALVYGIPAIYDRWTIVRRRPTSGS